VPESIPDVFLIPALAMKHEISGGYSSSDATPLGLGKFWWFFIPNGDTDFSPGFLLRQGYGRTSGAVERRLPWELRIPYIPTPTGLRPSRNQSQTYFWRSVRSAKPNPYPSPKKESNWLRKSPPSFSGNPSHNSACRIQDSPGNGTDRGTSARPSASAQCSGAS
jgi:hypothetical protein